MPFSFSLLGIAGSMHQNPQRSQKSPHVMSERTGYAQRTRACRGDSSQHLTGRRSASVPVLVLLLSITFANKKMTEDVSHP